MRRAKASEAPENLKELVGGMKVPREMAGYIFSQIEETKNGLLRVVGKEIHDFLEQTNLGHEMQKMLTTVQFEISTTIRFKPNTEAGGTSGHGGNGGEADGESQKLPKPEVKTEVQMKRDERPRERRRNRE